jgi:hypothetical protein
MHGETWVKVAATDPKQTFGVLFYFGETIDKE